MIPTFVALALGATVVAACGQGAGGDTKGGPYDALYAGLCKTRTQTADPQAARDSFFDRAHQPLHELAADAASRDRATSARLLESKEAVERDISSGSARLGPDLDLLLAATRTAIARSGYPLPPACKKGA